MARANDEVAKLLAEYADLLALAGEDQFRVRAYQNAARSVAGAQRDVSEMELKELTKLPYVGTSIAEKIREYLTTGHIAKLEELRGRVGAGVRELLDVPALGPKRAAIVHERLGISTVDELRRAAEEGRLRDLEGFGPTLEEKILRACDGIRGETRIPVAEALTLATAIVEALEARPEVERVSYAGSLRRVCPTIGDIDVLVAATEPAPVMEAFTSLDLVTEVLARGDTKSSVVTSEGVQVDLRVVEPAVWGAALMYFTGSKAHNVKLRERAVQRGWKLSEYGLFDGRTRLAGRTEEEVYEALGLPWIAPTLREDTGEVEAAAEDALPEVVEVAHLKGDLHTHTNLTDGVAPLEEMVAAAEARGYRYYAVTDHAPLLYMQRMTREKALAQRERLRELQAKTKVELLHGSELNIQEDGSLDWDDEFLAGFDVLVASVHSHFEMPKAQMTKRLLRAIEHPCVNIIGHPTARRTGKRPAIEFDVEEVCKAAAREGVALEVNGQPERLDLPGELVRAARSYGAKLAIDTDAHAVPHLEYVELGVATAQRGWAEKGDVINALPLRELRRFLAKGRRARR